jgi:Fic-DOC domain mobile mystery protein B
MFSKVWKWAGKKRKTNKNIGVDWHQIDIELKKLIGDLQYWQENKIDIMEISARLHHRLVKIHPFENGNGRWARFAVNLFLQNQGLRTVNWPEKELFVNSVFRKKYIDALKQADLQKYDKLIALHIYYSSM